MSSDTLPPRFLSSLSQKAGRFFLTDFRTVGLFYLAVIFVATLLQYYIRSLPGEGVSIYRFNNYIIFRQAFFHLLDNKDLYVVYPAEQWDLFKYSPTFALLMGPMAILPDVVGLVIWNALNAGLLYYAIRRFPVGSDRAKIAILWFVFQELLTSVQNCQSNALMAALLMIAFIGFENKNVWLAALCIVLGMYIKIFAVVGAALFLLYPRKGAFILWSALWFVLLALLPLLVSTPDQLMAQYASWWKMLGEDASVSDGLSVMGWLKSWFGWEGSKNIIVLAGVLLFCLPYVQIRKDGDPVFRMLFLASVLIWIVIFNHKAESPTFVIAMTGVGLWYFMRPSSSVTTTLVIFAFVFTSLSPTDLFPSWAYHHLVQPFKLKAVFCIFIWFWLIYEMVSGRYSKQDTKPTHDQYRS